MEGCKTTEVSEATNDGKATKVCEAVKACEASKVCETAKVCEAFKGCEAAKVGKTISSGKARDVEAKGGGIKDLFGVFRSWKGRVLKIWYLNLLGAMKPLRPLRGPGRWLSPF